jgi:3-deoxy-D-manno-octulosonic-acid transferase
MSSVLLTIYKTILRAGTPFIKRTLSERLDRGKEDPLRISERYGIASLPRPSGTLIWFHVASVGEAQSIRVIIDELLNANSDLHILVTSVTRTSADLLNQQLPPRAFHQYAPFDHPNWVKAFLNHWQPSMAIWVESELWPSMLAQIRKRYIHAALLNARLSPTSLKRWKFSGSFIREILSTFNVILCQTSHDETSFETLGATRVVTTGNIKYCAEALSYDAHEYEILKTQINTRPCWIYASTHDDEESIAATIHKDLKTKIPNLLTLIAPRHPERTAKIYETLKTQDLNIIKRSSAEPITDQTDILLIDTMGELGLFYRLSKIAMIGRSLSLDGGGGHNPLEAMRLGSVIIHGKAVQNLQDIYDDIHKAEAGITVHDRYELAQALQKLFNHPQSYKVLLDATNEFILSQKSILEKTLDELEPLFLQIGIKPPRSHIHNEKSRV